MFTGIIQDIGIIKSIKISAVNNSVVIKTNNIKLLDVNIGDSIAVNGVCLTTTRIVGDTYTADISNETLQTTTLKGLSVGQTVNLEKALTLSTPLGGHLVSGHVDGVGRFIKKSLDGNSSRYYFTAPKKIMPYIACKGSITVQGVSLTVNSINDKNNYFDVAIIPHTEEETNLGQLIAGDEVNLEIDLVARYITRFLVAKDNDNEKITLDEIIQSGF